MKLSNILFYSSLFIFSSSLLSAQEHQDRIAPLRTNPVLVKYAKDVKNHHAPSWRLISDSIMAKLPFIDDFSRPGPYPFDSLWMDNAAFINNTYAMCPYTLGVATLDGVNNEGQPYNPNCPIGASYPADSLTSRPIDMSGYSAALDSVYLSFYWQAGGLGYAPLTNDTLLLQFRTSTVGWTTIWYQLGYTPSLTDTNMHLVMIPVLNKMYNILDSAITLNPYDHNFQFRFKNYACTSGNVDQWNLDYVYMAKDRYYKDTITGDVSFVYESPSMLANYQYMPWEQFTANDLRDTMFIYERNNDDVAIYLNYYNTITPSSYQVSNYQGGHANIRTYYPWTSDYGWNNNPGQTHVPIKSYFNYSPLSGPTDITLTHILQCSPDFIAWNDTVKFKQVFSDYFAYDDGTAEAAYFINGTPPIDLAYQITLNRPDTLRGLLAYFNYIFVNPANYAFRLALWDNTGVGGSPGNLLFENDSIYSPKFIGTDTTPDSLNGFVFYPFHFVHPDTALSGTFYVGWIQTYGDSLNIGYDYNTDHHNQIYYNVGNYPGGWDPGTYPGSMMMRPVFGVANSHSAQQNPQAPNPVLTAEALSVYPNPANDMIYFNSAIPANSILKIYTADGREYMDNTNFSGNSLDVSTIPTGFYILKVTSAGGNTIYKKLLIQR
jgi:hypothetical protein